MRSGVVVRGRRLLAFVALLSLALAFLPPSAPPSAGAGAFIESFDGSPAAPLPWHLPSWDVTVHSRDVSTFGSLEPMRAGHGSDCSAPPATHSISSYEDAVFLCRDHLMTAIKAEGYGVIYLTPNQLVDFSAGEAVVRFDVSTLRTSIRDWIDLWITPFDENLQLVGDVGDVDLGGSPRRAIQVRQDQFSGNTIFRGSVVNNFIARTVGASDDLWLESILAPSAAVRTTFELRVSRTHLKFGIPSLNAWWVDNTIPDLGWTSGVLQIGHHSYNPEKDCGLVSIQCTANTWHWDNVSISPAVPFTILQPDRRRADQSAPELRFSGPAPANAHLRFTGIGGSPGVSFDGGITWQTARLQPSEQILGDEHLRSYWTPIPSGAQTVRFRATNWFGGSWLVRDATIWASSAPSSAPAPTTPPPAVVPPPAATPPPAAPPPGVGVTVPPPSNAQPAARVDGFHSAWMDQTSYPRLQPGETGAVTVRFRNTGSESWVVGAGGRHVNLGVIGDSTRFADLGMSVGWLSANRPATSTEHVVAPGQIGTFTFTVRAPQAPGSYRIDVAPVVEGLVWLEDQGVFIIVTSDNGLGSAWVSQSPWPVLRADEVSDPITITFRNTGARPWVRGLASQQVVLGIVGDDKSWGAVGWPAADRPAMPAETVVSPGQLGTFTFRIRAPAVSGEYALPLRLVVDGVSWLDDDGVYLLITVLP